MRAKLFKIIDFLSYAQAHAKISSVLNGLQIPYGKTHGSYDQTHTLYAQAHGRKPGKLFCKLLIKIVLDIRLVIRAVPYMEWFMVGPSSTR